MTNQLSKLGSLGNKLAKIKSGGDLSTIRSQFTPPARSDDKTKKVVKEAANRRDSTRVAFLIDATGSRSSNWNQSQQIQADMFRQYANKGEAEIRIVCHGGDRVKDLGWFMHPNQAVARMSELSCALGHTKIANSINTCLETDDGRAPSVIFMVGDACEEGIDSVKNAALNAKAAGTKIYAFHDQTDGFDEYAERVFKMAAEVTGGVFVVFGDKPDFDFGDVMKAAAVMDTDKDAFDRLVKAGNKAALALKNGQKKLGSGGYNQLHLGR